MNETKQTRDAHTPVPTYSVNVGGDRGDVRMCHERAVRALESYRDALVGALRASTAMLEQYAEPHPISDCHCAACRRIFENRAILACVSE